MQKIIVIRKLPPKSSEVCIVTYLDKFCLVLVNIDWALHLYIICKSAIIWFGFNINLILYYYSSINRSLQWFNISSAAVTPACKSSYFKVPRRKDMKSIVSISWKFQNLRGNDGICVAVTGCTGWSSVSVTYTTFCNSHEVARSHSMSRKKCITWLYGMAIPEDVTQALWTFWFPYFMYFESYLLYLAAFK